MDIAFVAGSTGYTGRNVVQELRARGIRTIAHVRPDSSRLEEWRARFQALGAEVDVTPWEEAAMTATLERLKPTVVFSLLGTTQARMRRAVKAHEDPDRLSYEAIDYGLTALLIRATVRAGLRPRFVYLSSIGAAPGAAGAYMQARWKAEEDLRRSGLPHLIARPSFITGADREENRPLERWGARVGNAALSVVGALGGSRVRDRYSSLSGHELAAGLVRLALEPSAESRVVEAGELRGA